MGGIKLRKALDDYKTVHMPYRNFAERTRVEYLNDLLGLTKFLGKMGINNVKEINLPVIERYVAHLEQEGVASLTRKRKVVGIRSFLSFLYHDGYIDTNIAPKLVLPYTEITTPHVLTQNECNRIRNACAGNIRDTAIFELLLQTGMKLSELIRLTLDDIELGKQEESNPGSVRILGGRGKKERVITLNNRAAAALKYYLKSRKNTGNDILFLNRSGEPLGERGVQKVLRKSLKRARVGNASVRTLRHTFGAHKIAIGIGPKLVQEVMGYKDSRSISVYVSLVKGWKQEL